MWYVHIGDKLDFSLIQPICNMHFNKPAGGLWASPVLKDKDFVSEWDACEQDMGLNKPRAYCNVFQLCADAKIYIIDCYEDFKKLIVKYEAAELFPFPLPNKTMATLNFEAIAKVYDAILLTSQGQLETRYPFFGEYNLYGWDCESLLVLNTTCITNLESIPYDKFLNMATRIAYL